MTRIIGQFLSIGFPENLRDCFRCNGKTVQTSSYLHEGSLRLAWSRNNTFQSLLYALKLPQDSKTFTPANLVGKIPIDADGSYLRLNFHDYNGLKSIIDTSVSKAKTEASNADEKSLINSQDITHIAELLKEALDEVTDENEGFQFGTSQANYQIVNNGIFTG